MNGSLRTQFNCSAFDAVLPVRDENMRAEPEKAQSAKKYQWTRDERSSTARRKNFQNLLFKLLLNDKENKLEKMKRRIGDVYKLQPVEGH